ncbi:MAG: DNA gyrase modulator, partial [Betaproteobacteria bacterium]
MPLDSALPAVDIDCDFWSLRFVEEASDSYIVRKDVALPFATAVDKGVMASVYAGGGYGYAATGDTSPEGVRRVLARAREWARVTARHAIADSRQLPRPAPQGAYASPATDIATLSRRDWFDLLLAESRSVGSDPRIVDWEASVDVVHTTQRLVTSGGGDVVQRYRFLMPSVSVTAHADGDTIVRTLNGYRGICQQGGEEILARFGFAGSTRRIVDEALELLAAPNCPSGPMDVLLAPDQMVLQIHESIG